jgi:predicted Fe-S protein YdhL (DUF1289 family)
MMEQAERAGRGSLAQTIEQAKLQRPVGSPCIDVCRLHPLSGYCEGCLRSRAEIKAWKSMADDDRLALLERIAARAAQQTPENLP